MHQHFKQTFFNILRNNQKNCELRKQTLLLHPYQTYLPRVHIELLGYSRGVAVNTAPI